MKNLLQEKSKLPFLCILLRFMNCSLVFDCVEVDKPLQSIPEREPGGRGSSEPKGREEVGSFMTNKRPLSIIFFRLSFNLFAPVRAISFQSSWMIALLFTTPFCGEGQTFIFLFFSSLNFRKPNLSTRIATKLKTILPHFC